MLHTHSPIGFRGSHIRCSAAAALMLAAGSAHGQMWNVGNGNWNVASNWSPMTVPNSMTADVTLGGASGYIVTIGSISPIIQNLAISNANAVLTIGSSRALQPHGDTVINNGLINVNTNGANGSYIQFFNADTLLTGNGVIALNAAGNILDRAYLWYGVSTDVLTQDVNHSILGSGNIYVAMVNNGTINADIDGGILQLFTTNKANAGTIGATNGGILRINGISIDQTGGGAMYAQGAGTNPSEIRLSNATLTGGTLDMLSPAAAFVTAGNATLIDTVVSGTINVENTRNLHIGGALYDHDGTINVNSLSGSSGSSITFGDPGKFVQAFFTISFVYIARCNGGAGIAIQHRSAAARYLSAIGTRRLYYRQLQHRP